MGSALGVSLSAGAVGLILLALAIWVMIRKVKGGGGGGGSGTSSLRGGGGSGGGGRWLKAAVWLMLLAGLFLANAGFRVVSLIVNGGRDTVGAFAGHIFGVTGNVIMLIIGIIIVLELWLAIGPKAKTRKWHPYMALLAFPVFLAGAGFLYNLAQQLTGAATAWLS